MTLLGVAIAWWALFYALELWSHSETYKVLWAQMQYLAIVTVPVAWLLFTLRHTNLDRLLLPRLAGLLMVIPVVTVALVWTNGAHGLIWREVILEPAGSLTAFAPEYGGWFYVNLGYAYILVLAGSAILVSDARRSFRTFRLQSAFMVTAALVPLIGNLLLIAGVAPPGGIDLTPFGFAISVVVAAWGFARLGLLDLVPVARATVMDELPDGLLVVDDQRRIVDVNGRAARILNASQEEFLGGPLPADLSERVGLPADPDEDLGQDVGLHRSVELGPASNRCHYDVGVSAIAVGSGRVSGTVLLLRDVTRREEAERALKATNKGLEAEMERRRTVERALARSEQIRRLQVAEEAKEAERKRLSEELHDETLVQLSSVVAELGLVARMLRSGTEGAEEALDELRDRVKNTESGLRRIIRGIYPTVLTNLGLVPALRNLLGELSRRSVDGRSGVAIELTASGFGEDRLPEETEIAVYRVVQQAVANSLKHAQAATIRIELNWEAEKLHLRVSDDGVGFDVTGPEEGPEAGHFGLANLRDRVTDAGGELSVRSENGAGTVVQAVIPTPGRTVAPSPGRPVSFSVTAPGSPVPEEAPDPAMAEARRDAGS